MDPEEIKEDESLLEVGTEAGEQELEATDGAQASAEQDAPADSWKKDHEDLAKSYGIEDLSDYGSEAEFLKVAALFDKQLVRQKPVQKEVTPEPETVPQAAAKPAPSGTKKKPSKLDIAKYEQEGYDQNTIEAFRGHNELIEHIESLEERLSIVDQLKTQAEQYRAQEQQQAALNAFHDSVDNLDYTRYGRSIDKDGHPIKLSPAQNESRKKLFESMWQIKAGVEAAAARNGSAPTIPPLPVLLKRAELLAFGDVIVAEENRKRIESIAEQSKRRRPVAAAKSPPTSGQAQKPKSHSVYEESQTVMADKELQDLWNSFKT